MLYQLPDSAIDAFLDEDMPYGDLTTHLLGIGNERGTISFISREVITVCCTEETARLLERCGATVTNMVASGSVVQAGSELLVANGSAAALHAGCMPRALQRAHARLLSTPQPLIPTCGLLPRVSRFPVRKKLPLRQLWRVAHYRIA